MPIGVYKRTKKHKANMSKSHKGVKLSKKHKNSISKSLKGKTHGYKFKKGHKINKGKLNGKNNPFYGKKHSKKSKIKMSKNHVNFSLKNHPNWQGGISYEPYSTDWTETLRTSIRERDNYTCQMPGCNKKQGDRAHDVHHIDYDKKNCDTKNLITLCCGCHRKTNYNRKNWTNLFTKQLL